MLTRAIHFENIVVEQLVPVMPWQYNGLSLSYRFSTMKNL